MKKLKKVLSLVLVLAMALSVFGVCASAANVEDYADADEITYTEAVGVLSGLGVLEGDENGFRPADTLTRAEAAKIASYLIGLQDEVVQGPSFSDVAEDNWARGWIAICESQELVHGNGDGTFTPDGTLTGYEWEKMVLCALGYNAEIEKMVGDSWQGGVANLAKKTGLLNGLDEGYKAADEITREEAAKIAFNALFVTTVVYPKADDLIATPGTKTLGELIFGLTVDVQYNVFAAPVAKVFTNGKTGADEVVYATFPIEAVEEYNNVAGGVELADIKEDLEDSYGAPKAPEVKVYSDGSTTAQTLLGGRGTDVSLYVYEIPGKGVEYRVVEINTYVAKIGENNVAIQTYAPNSNGVTKASEITGLVNSAYLAAGDLAKDDIITYNVGNTGKSVKTGKDIAVNVEVKAPTGQTATTVSYDGTLTDAQNKDGYVAFDKGDKEYYSKKAVYGGNLNKVAVDTYYGVVYDNYGNIIYIAEAKRQTVSDKGHLYLVAAISYTDKKVINDTADLFYPTVVTEGGAQALVIEYTDDSAEAKIVDLAVAQDKAGNYVLVNEYGLIGPDCTVLKANVDQDLLVDYGKGVDLQESFVEYYVNDNGEYILKACADAKHELCTDAATKDITVTKEYQGTPVATVASNATKLTYITATVDPYTVEDLNRTTLPEVLKTITLSVSTATGYKQFVDFEGNAAYLETKDGVATVGAVIGTENVQSTVSYGMYIGTYEESSVTGEVYSFALSDGTTAKYNVEEPAKNAYGDFKDVLAKKQDNQITGNKNQFADLKIGDVVRLVRNSKGNVVAYTKLDADYYGEASKVSYVNGEGWLTTTVQVEGDKAKTTYFGSATYFGGSYIDATGETPTYKAASVTGLVDSKAGNKYVAVYTEDVDSTNKRDGEEIVFVKAVDASKVKIYTVNATYENANSLAGPVFKADATTVNGASKNYADIAEAFNDANYTFYAKIGTDNVKAVATAKEIAAADWALYDGETFTLTIEKTVYTNPAKAADYAVTSAVAAHTWTSKEIVVYSIADDGNGESWTIKENVTLSNGDGWYEPYTVKGDAQYISANNAPSANGQFSGNHVAAGNSLKLIYKDGVVVTVYNLTSPYVDADAE